MGDVLIGDMHRGLHLISQLPQAGAQNHGHLGDKLPQALLERAGAGQIIVIAEFHSGRLSRKRGGRKLRRYII